MQEATAEEIEQVKEAGRAYALHASPDAVQAMRDAGKGWWDSASMHARSQFYLTVFNPKWIASLSLQLEGTPLPLLNFIVHCRC